MSYGQGTKRVKRGEEGLEQKRGTVLLCTLREGLSLEIRKFSRMISSSEEGQEDRIFRSSREKQCDRCY